MARWRNPPRPVGIPAWVREAWMSGDDSDRQLADAWLDDLWHRDRPAWEVALIEFLSTPGYT